VSDSIFAGLDASLLESADRAMRIAQADSQCRRTYGAAEPPRVSRAEQYRRG